MITPGNSARRILVVDDDAVVCDTIRMVLAADQHEVETATSAQGALAAFQPDRFDLVVIDYVMPDMKGDKLAAAIKAQASQQPILMMTAHGEALRLGGNFPLGVDLVMSKPFDIQELRQAVVQLTAKT